MKQYVGIPFTEASCWDLCQKVYAEQYNIRLPSLRSDGDRVPCVNLEGPEEGCLVRVVREAPLSEHWGVYIAGCVLHAQKPSSVMTPLRRFMQNHASVEFFKL